MPDTCEALRLCQRPATAVVTHNGETFRACSFCAAEVVAMSAAEDRRLLRAERRARA